MYSTYTISVTSCHEEHENINEKLIFQLMFQIEITKQTGIQR